MFKRGFQTRLSTKETLVDLAPLVDVVFLLLIFFFVTSEVLPLKSIPLRPPTLSLEAPPIPTEIPIMMDRFGVIYVGSHKKVATLQTLGSLLDQSPLQKGGFSIVLSVDREIPYGMFLSLFSSLYQTGHPIRLVFENSLSEESG